MGSSAEAFAVRLRGGMGSTASRTARRRDAWIRLSGRNAASETQRSARVKLRLPARRSARPGMQKGRARLDVAAETRARPCVSSVLHAASCYCPKKREPSPPLRAGSVEYSPRIAARRRDRKFREQP